MVLLTAKLVQRLALFVSFGGLVITFVTTFLPLWKTLNTDLNEMEELVRGTVAHLHLPGRAGLAVQGVRVVPGAARRRAGVTRPDVRLHRDGPAGRRRGVLRPGRGGAGAGEAGSEEEAAHPGGGCCPGFRGSPRSCPSPWWRT